MESLFIADADAMQALGERLAARLAPGAVVFLRGDLGTGKTTLVQGILKGYGYSGAVRSPTYTLVESYDLKPLPLHHFDLYRLGDPEELDFIGIRDYLDGEARLLVEWPDKGRGMLPGADARIELSYEKDGRRVLVYLDQGSAGAEKFR